MPPCDRNLPSSVDTLVVDIFRILVLDKVGHLFPFVIDDTSKSDTFPIRPALEKARADKINTIVFMLKDDEKERTTSRVYML